MSDSQEYPLSEALKALHALREAGGLPPETFPIPAFVGMISDEVESLRKRGKTDEEIASIVEKNSAIRITAQQIRQFYATPDERHHHGE
jgi:hypothetical protein